MSEINFASHKPFAVCAGYERTHDRQIKLEDRDGVMQTLPSFMIDSVVTGQRTNPPTDGASLLARVTGRGSPDPGPLKIFGGISLHDPTYDLRHLTLDNENKTADLKVRLERQPDGMLNLYVTNAGAGRTATVEVPLARTTAIDAKFLEPGHFDKMGRIEQVTMNTYKPRNEPPSYHFKIRQQRWNGWRRSLETSFRIDANGVFRQEDARVASHPL